MMWVSPSKCYERGRGERPETETQHREKDLTQLGWSEQVDEGIISQRRTTASRSYKKQENGPSHRVSGRERSPADP